MSNNAWKSFTIGLIGGFVGTYAMGKAMSYAMKKMQEMESGEEKKPEPPFEEANISLVGKQYQKGESSTAAVGRIIYTKLTEDTPSQEKKQLLSQLVHWGYGIFQGGMYGICKHALPGNFVQRGVTWGTLLWVWSEIGVPMLGLAKSPTTSSPKKAGMYFTMHAVYGVALASVADILDEVL